jgi:hypothetical protein
MADTKLSALTALGGAPATGDLVEVVDISDTTMSVDGTNKKMTVANIFTSPSITSPTITTSPTAAGATWTDLGTVTTADINGGTVDGAVIGGASAAAITGTTITANTGFMPDANDGAYLGQAGTAFSDLFLAEGGVINWDSGDVTLTQTGDTLNLAGGTLILPAVTTTVAPLKFTTGGTLLTTAEDGAIEMDDNCFYGTVDAGNRGVIPLYHIIRADSSRNLTSSASEQAIFNSPTNGRITLETGVYRFNMMIYLTAMSATSGNYAIDPLGAGTATCGSWLYHGVGIDNTTPTNAGTQTGAFAITQQTAASLHTAGTGTAAGSRITGTFEVTGAGTMIPSITLVTAAAATLAAGSFFECWRVGSTTMASVGQWD